MCEIEDPNLSREQLKPTRVWLTTDAKVLKGMLETTNLLEGN